MEFVEAMGIMNRMCKASSSCEHCPLYTGIMKTRFSCRQFVQNYPEEVEAILAKWNAEHPLKTLKDVFNEAFPNAPKHGTRAPDIPGVCVSKVGYTPIHQPVECCDTNCVKCWNQPYEENAK